MNIAKYINTPDRDLPDNLDMVSFLTSIFSETGLKQFSSFVSTIIDKILSLEEDILDASYQENCFTLYMSGYELVKVKGNKVIIMSLLNSLSFDSGEKVLKNITGEQREKYIKELSDSVVEIHLDVSFFAEEGEESIEDISDSIINLLTELYIKSRPLELAEGELDRDLLIYFNKKISPKESLKAPELEDVAVPDKDKGFNKVKKLIELDEKINIEFKPLFFEQEKIPSYIDGEWEITENERENEHTNIVLETINAFLNSREISYLLVGVSDDGCCTGIDGELNNVKGVKDQRSYLERVYNLVDTQMGSVASSNLDLDFITISSEKITSIDYPLKCNLKNPIERYYKHLHRDQLEEDVTIALITVTPSNVPIFFSPLKQTNPDAYFSKSLFFVRGGDGDRKGKGLEDTINMIKNRYPEYF